MKRSRQVIALIVLLIVLGGILVLRGQRAGQDRSAGLEKTISGAFLSFGLVDDNLVRKTVDQRRDRNAKYTFTFLEYNAPKAFEWNGFQAELKARLKDTPFCISRADREARRNVTVYRLAVSSGTVDVLSVMIHKAKRAAVTEPAAAKAVSNPRVAIVIDDFGYNLNNLNALLDIKQPVTLSVLPNQRYSGEVARRAESRGYEVILHLPLEPHRKDIAEEAGTIKSGMKANDIASRITKEIASVPGIDGVSNHMGSKATEDETLMVVGLKNIKAHKLYFFDSLTSERSVCGDVAGALGLKYGRRDIFLDNSSDIEFIEGQLNELERLAFARGKAIAICHDRKNTIAALSTVMPRMAKEGIKFVYLSELVE